MSLPLFLLAGTSIFLGLYPQVILNLFHAVCAGL
jgi:hypothetical protein